MIIKIVLIVVVLALAFNYFEEERRTSVLKKYVSDEVKKGAELERAIKVVAESKGLKVVDNIIIPNLTGRTTEVDLVILSRKGFYAIESKNYNGFISGNKNWKKWTVTYNEEKGIKRTFLNPIKQNLNHIYCLRKMFPRYRFENIVIFGDNARLSKIVSETSNVKSFSDFEDFLKSTLMHKEDIITDEEVESVFNFLSKYKNGNIDAHIEFVNSLK